MANAIQAAGGLISTSGDGVGYGTGAGGTQTQLTNKATTVVCNTICGEITMNNAVLNAGVIVSHTLTNAKIANTDNIILNHVSGGTVGSYLLNGACGSGSATIYVRNTTAGNLTEAIVYRFTVIKSVNS